MAQIRVTAHPEHPDQSVSPVGGQFWLADSPDRRVGGVLSLDPAGGSLQVSGTLLPAARDAFPSDVVVLGLTAKGRQVTIGDAYLRSVQSQRDPVTGAKADHAQDWGFFRLYDGALFEGGALQLFDGFGFDYPSLADWVRSPLTHEPPGEPGERKRVLEIEVPDDIEIPTDHGRLVLRWLESGTSGRTRSEVTVSPVFWFEPFTPMTVEDVHRLIVQPLHFFLTLATGVAAPNERLEVSLGHYRDESYRSATVPHPRTEPVDTDLLQRYWEHLIPFENVNDHLGTILGTWVRHAEAHRSALLAYFSVVERPTSMYGEEQFLHTVRALESWHRSAVGGEVMPDAEFNTLKAQIRGAVAPELWTEFLGPRLKHANSPSLKQRLEFLIGEAGPPLSDLVARLPKFLRRVVDSRDTLTHVGSEEQNSFEDEQLFLAQKVLSALLMMTMLRAAGLGDQAGVLIQRSPTWRWVKVAEKRL